MSYSYAIYFGGGSSNSIVEYCTIDKMGMAGLHYNADFRGECDSMIIRYNTFSNGGQVTSYSGYGILNTALKNSKIYYNIFYNNITYGIMFGMDANSGQTQTNILFQIIMKFTIMSFITLKLDLIYFLPLAATAMSSEIIFLFRERIKNTL